jgi:hypothetical protein
MEAVEDIVVQIYNELLSVDRKNERILVGISGAPGAANRLYLRRFQLN